MNLSPKGWFILAIGVIALTDVAVILDIPVLRQISGVIFLAVLPGLLILLLLKLTKLGLAEKLVLTVGLSVTFLMLLGVLVNQISIAAGCMTPLSTIPLTLWLSLSFIALLVGAYIRNREAFSSTLFHIELNTKGKLCLLLPTILPLLSILGMRSLNTSGSNVILLIGLFLIPVSIILITLLRREITKDVYPVAIVMISLALLTMYWLRSEHIWGHDVHMEYYLFYMTQASSHWSIIENSVLDSCLSISLLPAIFQSLLNLDSAEYLFKGVYVLICAFGPLSIFVISRKYIGAQCAFLAALFFAFQAMFLVAAGNPRSILAVIFFALFVMVLFSSEIRGRKQRGLLIAFMAAAIVSHYGGTFLFLFLVLFTWLLRLIFRKYMRLSNITQTMVILFAVLIFFWYAQITELPFAAGVDFVYKTLINLGRFFIEDARSPEVATLLAQGITQKPFLSWINYVITYASFAFIAVGVIGTLIKHKVRLSTSQSSNQLPSFLRTGFDAEYFLMALLCCALLVVIVALPFVSIRYEMQRVYSQVTVILAAFFVTGGMMISRSLKLNPQLLILLVLIPYFLFTTGTAYEVAGIHPILLSSESQYQDYSFVYEQERVAAQWLKEDGKDNSKVYITSIHEARKLVSQGKFSPRLIGDMTLLQGSEVDGYIYLGYNNVVKGKLAGGGDVLYDMSDYSDMFINKDRLYANGGSEVWR